MACMEHECVRCGEMVFNNQGSGGKCPKCGGTEWRSHWDEEDDHRRAKDDDR